MAAALDTLRRVEIFKDLEDDTLGDIAARGDEIAVEHGEIVCRVGQPGENFFVVLDGRVHVEIGQGANRRTVKTHGPSGFFGEMSLLTGAPISADVVASGHTLLLRLTREQFGEMLDAHSSISTNLTTVLALHIADTNRQLAQERLARVNAIHRAGDTLADNVTTLHIAASAARQSNRSLLVVDLESSLLAPLAARGLTNGGDPMSLFELGAAVSSRDVVRTHCISLGDQVDVLCLPKPLSRCPEVSPPRITDFLAAVRRHYDSVLIDTGCRLHERTESLLRACDHVYLLAAEQPGHSEVSQVVKTLDLGPSRAATAVRIGLVTDQGGDSPRTVLQPLVDATHIRGVFTLSPLRGPDLRLDESGLPLLDEASPTGRRLASQAREVMGMRVGLALGSGGAKGFAHIGIMRVLEEIGLPVDAIVGCSMGAIIGACFAQGRDSHVVEQMARDLWARKGAFFDWQIPPWCNIVKGKKVDRMADRGFGDAEVLDCPIPYAAMGFDLITGKEIVIDSGTLKNAVRASGSMPGIMRPVKWDGMYLVDGGVSNKVPANVLADWGTDFNIAVNVAPEVDPGFYDVDNPRRLGLLGRVVGLFSRSLREMYREPSIVQIMGRTYSTSASKLTEQHLHFADINIRPDTSGIGMLDFLKLDEAIEAGIASARVFEDEIKRELAALRG